MSVEKFVVDTVKASAKVAEAAVKKAWTVMEAAAEKKAPTEYLSPKAVGAIQGVALPGDK